MISSEICKSCYYPKGAPAVSFETFHSVQCLRCADNSGRPIRVIFDSIDSVPPKDCPHLLKHAIAEGMKNAR